MKPATLVLRGGRVYAPASNVPATAVAVDRDVIVAVGSDEDVVDYVGPRTRVIDLGGRLVLPAFGDAHVHAISGGLESLRCNLLGVHGRTSSLEHVASYSASLPNDSWLLGGGWSMDSFPGGLPTALDLDSVSGPRPAFLPNRDHHSAWVNTEAMRIASIDRSTPDPFAGRIERDEHGEATGVLHDGAMALVARHIPPTPVAELRAALRVALATLHRYGITHWQDACVGEAAEIGVVDTYDTYRAASAEGWLSARVRGALWWDRSRGVDQIDELRTRREAARDGDFRATSVKIMVDGVCETFTAAMSRAYLGQTGSGDHRGTLFLEPDELVDSVRRLDDDDFQVHFHAIGDRAVSSALDAIEALDPGRRRRNRHHLAHLQFVAPSDLGRFARLGAIANFQPLWACNDDQMVEFTLPFVGAERAQWQYSIGSLWRRGARVAFGSDWPVSHPDPIHEMHVAVNRTLSAHLAEPGSNEATVPFRADQAITVQNAIDAFTRNVAYVNGDDDHLGQINVGFSADLVVLNQDLLRATPSDIGDTAVDLTIAQGQVVHGDE